MQCKVSNLPSTRLFAAQPVEKAKILADLVISYKQNPVRPGKVLNVCLLVCERMESYNTGFIVLNPFYISN